MTDSVSLSICGDVERPACLALAELTGAGFPRLAGPFEWDCFLSVTSVDRIEVTREPQQATAATIALARLER
jgi:hypothetical protein